MSDMKRTWLVQRLRKPFNHPAFGVDNPFSFGGGLRNGGLNTEAMALLRDIFSFDYMGAAEFEFGAVPKALDGLAKSADELVTFVVAIPLAQVPANWRDKNKAVPDGVAEVFVLCRAGHSNGVVERIEEWSREAFPRLKENLRLTCAMRPYDDWDGEVAGWLELDNGFFFFTDREMWRQTCELFGVKVAAVQP